MKETLILKLDRNTASPTESAVEGKKSNGNTPEQTGRKQVGLYVTRVK